MGDQNTADPGIDSAALDPARPHDQERRAHVAAGFTLALAGDCILSRPISQLTTRVPGLADIMALIRAADLGIGNLETTLYDPASFAGAPYCWEGDWPLSGLPACAEDLKALGFGLMARANNHALDWGSDGMFETDRHLARAGIVHAGSGAFLGRARAPAYVETPKGRVGLVSVATTYRPTSEATDSFGTVAGRPGLNPLSLGKITLLPPADFAALRGMAGAKAKGEHQITFAGQVFEAHDTAGYRYEMDTEDLAGLLRSIRHGKQCADLLVVLLHAHEASRDGYPEPPAAFLKDLARAAIDAGADVFSVSGLHHLGPMEIYNNRPIFYGLGNFIWSDIQEHLPAELFRLNRDLIAKSAQHPSRVTVPDFNALLNATSFTSPLVYETILPLCRFSGDRLTALELHPIDLGQGEPLTSSGVPRRATGTQAESILARLSEVSRDFGCAPAFSVADGIGRLTL